MPGSQEEMTKFQEDTVASSKVHVECTFPRLDVNLHTKDVFENIYNRWVDYREEMKVLQSTWNYSSWRKEKKKKKFVFRGFQNTFTCMAGPDRCHAP